MVPAHVRRPPVLTDPPNPTGRPLVSVVIPVCDGEAFVGETLRAVLAQTHRDLDVVVVDDGSVDGSRAVVEAVAGADPRVRTLASPRGGVGAARNAGLAAARGPFVTFLDHDDLLPAASVARRVEALAALPPSTPRFVYGRLDYLGRSPDGATTSPGLDHVPARTYAEAWHRLGITTPGQVLLHTAAARAVLGFPDARHLGGSDDRGFWLRLVEAGVLPHFLDEVVLRYRLHPAQASRTLAYKRARLALREATVHAGDPPRRRVPDDVARPVLARLALDLAYDLLDAPDRDEALALARDARARWPSLVTDPLWAAFRAKRRRKALGALPGIGPLFKAVARRRRRPPEG